jgi:flagellar motor switch/type III secretory pathway protein FliN
MSIQSILNFTLGTIIEFKDRFDSDLTLRVADQPIARGQAVKVGEHFGLRVTAVDTIRHRIDALGA